MSTRLWLSCLVVGACGAVAPAPAVPSTPSPAGLWGAEIDFAPAGEMAVRITRDGAADLAGQHVVGTRDGDELVAHFERGTLRWAMIAGAPHALWIQPAGITIVSYATAVVLEAQGDGWTGTIAPVPDRIRLYVAIGSDGTAFVRETERNLGKRLGMMRVEQHGSELAFRDRHGELAMHATLAGDRMHLKIATLDHELELTRRDRDHAAGFYARPAAEAHYTYAPPRATDDGWPVAALEDVGLAREPVREEIQRIVDAVPASPNAPALHALVIARHGKLVVDEYFAGAREQDLHDLRSAGKTFGTTVVGIAVDHHDLATGDRVVDALGEPPGPQDGRRAHMTVEHLLTMSSGLACDDDDDASPGNEDVMQQQTAQPDWYRYTWQLAMVREPGTKAIYCSATINLLGALLERRGHHDLAAFFFDALARPLDIRRAAINLMPTGNAYLGGGLRLRARDFAKLAQLVLDRGTWHGRQIVSADWLARATAAHASIHGPDDYGYGWWRARYTVNGRSVEAFYAGGNGGQLAVAVPELDIAIAIQAGNYSDYRTWKTFRDELVPRLLAAAAP